MYKNVCKKTKHAYIGQYMRQNKNHKSNHLENEQHTYLLIKPQDLRHHSLLYHKQYKMKYLLNLILPIGALFKSPTTSMQTPQ